MFFCVCVMYSYHRDSVKGSGALAPKGTIKAAAHNTCPWLMELNVAMAW